MGILIGRETHIDRETVVGLCSLIGLNTPMPGKPLLAESHYDRKTLRPEAIIGRKPLIGRENPYDWEAITIGKPLLAGSPISAGSRPDNYWYPLILIEKDCQ